MMEGLNKLLFFPKMSADVLYFSFSRSVLLLARARSLRSRACRFFEKSEKKNKTTFEYRLRTKLFFMRIMQKNVLFCQQTNLVPVVLFLQRTPGTRLSTNMAALSRGYKP